MKKLLFAIMTSAAIFASIAARAQDQKLVFMSETGTPVAEAEKIRGIFKAGFKIPVEYVTEQLGGPFVAHTTAEFKSGSPSVTLLGGSHGEFPAIQSMLAPLDAHKDKLNLDGMDKDLVAMGKLGTEHQYYVPWITAVYMGAASVKALEYLPKDADVNKLTYDQLVAWGKNIEKATGEKKIGLPGGPAGLLHRLITNSFVPAYTGGAVVGFKSPQAEQMWTMLKDLWSVTNPGSTSYTFMQDQLLSGDVWVAFDHNVRFMEVFNKRPDDFVAFPIPAGPAGRAYAAAVSGVGILKNGPDQKAAVEAIAFLTDPKTQQEFITQLGFFPPGINDQTLAGLSGGLRKLAEGVRAQIDAPDALLGYQPVGLGTRNGEFQKIYLDTFQRIVLRNQPIRETLELEAGLMNQILASTNAPCWPSDPVKAEVCVVK